MGKTALIEAAKAACDHHLNVVKGRLSADGFDDGLADLLKTAQWVEIPGYTVHVPESARDRATRREAADDARDADLILLVVDASRDDLTPEIRLIDAIDAYFAKVPTLDRPPILAVVVGMARLPMDGAVNREAIARAKLAAVRSALPEAVAGVVEVDPPAGLAEKFLPALAPLLDRAEKTAVLRHMYETSTRSKARRLIGQVGRQGRKLWSNLQETRANRKAGAGRS